MRGGFDRSFQRINGFILLIVSLTMIIPFIHLLAISLSSIQFVNANAVTLWPKGLNFAVYSNVFQMNGLWRAMGVSAYITIAGTALALLLNGTLAFALTRPGMWGRRWVMQGVLLTFIFTVSMIPGFLVVRYTGMLNTLWALIVPNATAAFYIIILKTFFQNVSSELMDAAKVDGCTEYRLFFGITLPLSMPVLATIALFHMVGQWNGYFNALIYIREYRLFPLQLVLQNLLVSGAQQRLGTNAFNLGAAASPQMMKAGVILFATFPMLVVYPFLQKYFVKGAMLGSLKE